MKAHVLIVDDDDALRRALADRFRFWGHEVEEAQDGEEALRKSEDTVFDLILLDLSMPGLSGLEVLDRLKKKEIQADKVVLTAHGSVDKAVDAVKRGADDFLLKPADFELLERVVARTMEKRRLSRVNRELAERARDDGELVVGTAPAMARVLETAERAAATNSTLLIHGESGTGKQVLAEHVHRMSPRARNPFVYVNCVAISDELIESTLFGHEKGAFTDAVKQKIGKLETASGGTAFLDEVGDISSRLQTKLLHFLESSEFERIGGSRTIRVDCRIVAATNKELTQEVEEGRFREDLFFRLNVIPLRLPPLRERREDVPVLAEAFRRRFAAELKRPGLAFAPGTLDAMTEYAWPGNVRELKNAIEHMAVLAPTDELTPDLFRSHTRSAPRHEEEDLSHLPLKDAMDRFRYHHIKTSLERAGGNQTEAARQLGMQRSHLNRVLKELGLRS